MTRIWPDGIPVTVILDDELMPTRFVWNDAPHVVSHIAMRWEVQTDWWSEAGETYREYVRLITKSGLLCDLFYDHLDPGWKLARVYD